MEGNERVWHREAIRPQVERTLCDLQTLGSLDGFYLAGGTGLALYLGHRRSHDLDFFSGDPVEPEGLIRGMKSLAGFAVASQAPDTLHVTVQSIKVSFLAYPYPVLFPFATFLGVKVADPRDIACMKLSAIANRGTKRDFVDLYVMAKQCGLAHLLERFKQKYGEVNQSLTHVLKSLSWFEDADKDPMPDMLAPLPWEDVKLYFRSEASRLSP
jgi:predicted nucleotidyltransferase component of viral defense system